MEDLDAGRIHRYLLDSRERAENCYYTDMEFTLNLTYFGSDGERNVQAGHLPVTVQKSASSMMAVLEKEGLAELLLSRETERYPATHEASYVEAAG